MSDRSDALPGRRVAILNWRDPWHHLAGGSERYAWEAAAALRDAGADVELWTARDAGQGRRELVDGIEVRRRGGPFTFYPMVLLLLVARRLRPGRRLDLVVDMDCGIPLFSPLVLSRRVGVLLVVHHVHQDQFGVFFGRPMAALGRFLERRLMPVVYRRVPTLAVSASTVAEMRSRLGWRGPVDVVPNGADPVPPHVDVSEPGRVAVLGRLVAHKHVDAVVRAAWSLPGVRLDVLGDGPERGALEALVAELGAGQRVTVHGRVSEADKARLLRRARLHVCASDAEGWGLVVVEAAAHGVPTLARDVPGLRDSVREGRTGWLLPPDGLGRLAAGIASALAELDDETRRLTVAAACREWAAGFTWPAMHTALRAHAEAALAEVTGQ